MTPTITVDASQANMQMIKLAGAVGVEAKDLVRGESRMLARDLIRLTPPFGTNPKAYRQGLRAVTKDFVKAVRPLKPENWKNESIADAVRRRDYGRVKAIMGNIPTMRHKRVEPFNKQFHRNAQNRRYRIRGGHIGKMLTLDREAWRERLKELQSRVGWMKSRWAFAFFALGGRSVPPWIKRHIVSQKNAVADLSRLSAELPTVTIGNTNPGARTQMGYNVERAVRRAGVRMRDKFIKVMLGHKYDIKNGVVRIHRPKQEGFSA